MLSSSKEYLQALREGKYLLFLEWPQFIAVHYSTKGQTLDADTTVNLLVFEWINNGFCEADAKQIALLCAVSAHETKPIRSIIDYAFTAISVATFNCMLFHHLNMHENLLGQDTLNMEQVISLVNKMMHTVDKATYEGLLAEQQIPYYKWVDAIPSEETEAVVSQISLIVGLRYVAEAYSDELDGYKMDNDVLKASRLSVVKRLVSYLNEQTEVSTGFWPEIDTYITKIKELLPAAFEKEYLSYFLAPSFSENTWEIIARIGVSFFKLLQPKQNLSATEELQKEKNSP